MNTNNNKNTTPTAPTAAATAAAVTTISKLITQMKLNDDNLYLSSYVLPITGITTTPSLSASQPLQPQIRRLVLRKNENEEYGFTLNRIVLYSNENDLQENPINSSLPPYIPINNNDDNNYDKTTKIKIPIEIIYIKNIKYNSVSFKAGLKERDRIIYVNNILINDKDYSQIIKMIENSKTVLELTVQSYEQAINSKTQDIQSTSSSSSISSIPSTPSANDLTLRGLEKNAFVFNFNDENLYTKGLIQPFYNNKPQTEFFYLDTQSQVRSPSPSQSSTSSESSTSTVTITSPINTTESPQSPESQLPSISTKLQQSFVNTPKKTKMSGLAIQKLKSLQKKLNDQYSSELDIVIPDIGERVIEIEPSVQDTYEPHRHRKHNSRGRMSPSIANLQEQIFKKQQMFDRNTSVSVQQPEQLQRPTLLTTKSRDGLIPQPLRPAIPSTTMLAPYNRQQNDGQKNPSSPSAFSKYIESVHKALNSNDSSGSRTPSHDTQSDYLLFLQLQAEEVEQQAKQQQSNNTDLAKRYVDFRRSLFDQQQQQLERSYPTVMDDSKPLTQKANSTPTSTEQPSYVSISFLCNNTIKPTYTGECKRIMQRTNMETVAERAAHFEDVDMDRYNRLKQKYTTGGGNQDEDTNENYSEQHDLLTQNVVNLAHIPKSAYQKQQPVKQQQQSNEWKYEPQIAKYYPTSNLLFSNNNYNINDDSNSNKTETEINKNSINKMINLNSNSKLYGNTKPQQANEQYYMNKQQQQQQQNELTSVKPTAQQQQLNRLNYNFNNYTNTNNLMNYINFNSNNNAIVANTSNNTSNKNFVFNNNPLPYSNTNSNLRLFNNPNRLSSSHDATSSTSTTTTTTTDSDLVSPPSSPQYPNYTRQQQQQMTKPQQPQTQQYQQPVAIVRQHSYLNAMKMNGDQYPLRHHQQQQQQQQQQNNKLYTQLQQKPYSNSNSFNDDYEFHETIHNIDSDISSLNTSKFSTNDVNKQQNKSTNSNSYLSSPATTTTQSSSSQQQSPLLSLSNDDNGVSTRRTTLLFNQNNNQKKKQQSSNNNDTYSSYSPNENNNSQDSLFTRPSTIKLQKDNKFTTPQSSRNTSIKKLKNFFGEKTPMVLQAVENKNIIASDTFLNTILETVKEGVLNCKILCKDGKRSTDRSWRPAWAVLKKNGALFLCKEKKDNIMIPSTDSYPINLKNSTIIVAADYTKRKNVFKVITVSNSEYLFQTMDSESMSEWIGAMQENSNATDKYVPTSSAANSVSTSNIVGSTATTTTGNIDAKMRRISLESNHNYYDLSKKAQNLLVQQQQQDQHDSSFDSLPLKQINTNVSNRLSEQHEQNENISPSRNRKDISPRREHNREWVRSMTRRIRDFMNSTSNVDPANGDYGNYNTNMNDRNSCVNFGVALCKCEPSSVSYYIPAVVEICTRLIELHLTDEGLYRKVGQKLIVNSLKMQMNKGIRYIDISDFNWDNPHAIVSLLKCFLNELPDSIITTQLYNEFIQSCRIEHHHLRLMSIKKLLRQLPANNYETLKHLSAHLRRVAGSHQHNKMNIKNLCIAFSQSIVRHNEANCETIKTDHMHQSLLIELILTYHDWLFDLNDQMTENVPNEIKDIEHTLLQQQYTYLEPTNYTDMLINILRGIRNKWGTMTTMSSANDQQQEQNDDSKDNNNRQSINIQFRSFKNEVLRNSRSVGAIVRNNLRIKDRSVTTTNSRIKSVSALDAYKQQQLHQMIDQENQYQQQQPSQNKQNKSTKSVKAKRKSKKPDIIEQPVMEQDNVQYTTSERVIENEEQKLEQTINQEYNHCKTLVKRNEQERERLNDMMRKLDTELVNAEIDLANEDTNLMAFILKNKTTNFRRKTNTKNLKRPTTTASARLKRRHTFTSFNESFNVNQCEFKIKEKPVKPIVQPQQSQCCMDTSTISSMSSSIYNNQNDRSSVISASGTISSSDLMSGVSGSGVVGGFIKQKTNQGNKQEIKFRNLLKDHIDTQFESLI